MKTFVIVSAIGLALSAFYMLAFCMVSYRRHFLLVLRVFPPVRLYEELIGVIRKYFPEKPLKNAYTLSLFLPYIAVRFVMFLSLITFLLIFILLYPLFFILYLVRLYIKKRIIRKFKRK